MDVVGEAMLAIEQREWGRLRPLLHPYMHWTSAGGRSIRGRTNVLALLERAGSCGPPEGHELRDGQIYRWVERSAR